MKYFLCFGSNVGDRGGNIREALNHLEKSGVRTLRSSSVYRTEPVDLVSQSWFFNQVVEVETCFNPRELLKEIKDVELKMGRKRTLRKGPRVIDIDIILAGEKVIRTDELTIPHPRTEKRNFVLLPLSEIAPGAVHPVLKKTVCELLKESADESAVEKIE